VWIIIECIFGEGAICSDVLGKLYGKRPLGLPRARLFVNIRMDLWGMDVYRVLLGKPDGKRQLGKPRRRWLDNVRMGLWVEGSV